MKSWPTSFLGFSPNSHDHSVFLFKKHFKKEKFDATLYNDLYGEAPPERGTFLRLQVYGRPVEISQVEVHNRVGKSVNSVCQKAQKS